LSYAQQILIMSLLCHTVLALTSLACACQARRVETQFPESPPVVKPSLAAILSSLQLAYQVPASRSRFHTRASTLRMQDQSDAEAIAQMEKEKLLERQKMMEEDPDLVEKMDKVNKGMKSATGVELAPWLQVDAEAVVKARREQEKRDDEFRKNQQLEISGNIPKTLQLSQLRGAPDVRIQWDSIDVPDLAGYEIQRTLEGEGGWETLCSYDKTKSLRADFAVNNGGAYDYTDEALPYQGVQYRVLAIEENGMRIGVSQNLIEVSQEAVNSILDKLGVGLLLGLLIGATAFGFSEDSLNAAR